MCWNSEVSLLTFGFICIICTMLIKRNLPNDILLASFIISYGTMQLLEFFMWIGQPCMLSNHIATILAYLLLFAHPLAIAIGIYFDKSYRNITQKTKLMIIYITILLMIVGIYLMYQSWNKYNYCSYPHKTNHHLVWDFPLYYTKMILPLCLLIAILFIRPISFLTLMICYFIIPSLLARYYFKLETSSGSFWCWIVAAFSIIAYMINGIINKK